MPQITKSVVDKLSTGIVWDSELMGFGCRSQGKGKFYILKFRVGKRQKWLTIGRHGSPWCPASARTEAKRLLGLIAQGTDPTIERDRAKATTTVRELATGFLEHVRARRKASTHDTYERLVRQHITPALGKYRTCDVASADVTRLHDQMSDTPSQANLVYRVLHTMFQFAEKRGVIPKGTNPVHGAVEKYEEKPRERYLTAEEFKRLGMALDQFRDEFPDVVNVVALLALTGCRKSEVLSLKWEYINTEAGIAQLPDSKTGKKVVYLNAAALELLQAICRGEQTGYIFPGRNEGHLTAVAKPWDRIRKSAGMPDLRMHDLRHAFASIAVSNGLTLHVTGGLLGHRDSKSTQRYSHLIPSNMADATNKVGTHIAGFLKTAA